MWLKLIEHNWITLHSLTILTGLVVYVIGSHTLHQRRHPASAVAWIITLVLVPYVALPLYLMFGSRKVGVYAPAAPLPAPAGKYDAATPGAGVRHLAAALGLDQPAPYAQLSVHEDGAAALRALRAGIEGAQHTLDVCTFILGDDALGEEITQALMARARAGVAVRLLIDGIGIYLGGHPGLARLREAGITVELFVPPLHSPLRGRTNLRNHRKMVLADGQWLWCGGRNLAAEYFEGAGGAGAEPPWVDLSFDLRGAFTAQAQQRFVLDWDFAVAAESTRAATLPAPAHLPAGVNGAAVAQLIPSGPDQGDDTVYAVLVASCFAARRRIAIATPYFVPDPTLMMALTLAARRGVAVDLLLPAHSNHRIADVARHRALRELCAAGARVWFLPGMIHAKAVVIDADLALVGSANLDARSLFLNYELMVAFYEPTDVERFAAWLARRRAGAVPYRAQRASLMREIGEGLVLWVAFQL
jgi:cardiolipin synthase